MSGYDFWDEQEKAEQEHDAQQNAISEAYQQGRQDILNELEQYRFGNRGGLVHWKDIEKLKEQK